MGEVASLRTTWRDVAAVGCVGQPGLKSRSAPPSIPPSALPGGVVGSTRDSGSLSRGSSPRPVTNLHEASGCLTRPRPRAFYAPPIGAGAGLVRSARVYPVV